MSRAAAAEEAGRPKLLVCHDMANNYKEDRWVGFMLGFRRSLIRILDFVLRVWPMRCATCVSFDMANKYKEDRWAGFMMGAQV